MLLHKNDKSQFLCKKVYNEKFSEDASSIKPNERRVEKDFHNASSYLRSFKS